jgi:nucleotide-binding universal stress UspA family protein
MHRYQRILVTTDFSELGNSAIPHAYSLLGRGPGTVFLCHVVERVRLPNPLYAHYTPGRMMTGSERAALVRGLEEKLGQLIPKLRPRGVKTEARVVETTRPIHEAICKLARTLKSDAIVIASHGHSCIERVLLGSTTDRVLRFARRPVLVVLH